MYCENCGNEIKAGQQYCPKCGAKVGSGGFRKQTIIFAIVIGILVAIIAFLLISFAVMKNNRRHKFDNKNKIETIESIEEEEEETNITTAPTTKTSIQPSIQTSAQIPAQTPTQTQATIAENYSTNAPFSNIPNETMSAAEIAAIQAAAAIQASSTTDNNKKTTDQLMQEAIAYEAAKAAEAAANAAKNGGSNVGPGGTAIESTKKSSSNLEQDGPSANFKTVKGVKEGEGIDDDDYDDDEDDEDEEERVTTKSKNLYISSKENIEDLYEDDDDNYCDIIYIKPIISGSTEEENDAINGCIDDMMEEVMDSMYTTLEGYSSAPKSVKFSNPTIFSQTSQIVKINMKATISLRTSGTRTITYVITYNRSDEEATLSKS